jgi:lipoprotein-anchoring transpeptidase ErfK/SrfK
MRSTCRSVLVASAVAASACVPCPAPAMAAGNACSTVPGAALVGAPTSAASWRAEAERRTAVFKHLPGKRSHASRRLTRLQTRWLLVIGHARTARRHCWLPVRLPRRPNAAKGWIDAKRVKLEENPWRIAVSTRRRRLMLYSAGVLIRTARVVVGKPSTPTPVGLFAVVSAIRWHPNAFLGSWVLELTAHSGVLRDFDGGDGTVGIHGRGGASLLDPLGSARSHGCIRLANQTIDLLVRTIGVARLPGTPVRIT